MKVHEKPMSPIMSPGEPAGLSSASSIGSGYESDGGNSRAPSSVNDNSNCSPNINSNNSSHRFNLVTPHIASSHHTSVASSLLGTATITPNPGYVHAHHHQNGRNGAFNVSPTVLSSLSSSSGAGSTNLSDWYVAQSGGMPTPPSNEPSPLGHPSIASFHPHHLNAAY